MGAPRLGTQRNGSAQQNPSLEIKLSWGGSLPLGDCRGGAGGIGVVVGMGLQGCGRWKWAREYWDAGDEQPCLGGS